MDQARELLYKYGWREGKGLGRNEDGIVQAVKPKLKFDTTGVGYDHGKQFTDHWWQNVYNSAANNIKIRKEKDGVAVETAGEQVDVTASKYKVSRKKDDRKVAYGNFLQRSMLTGAGEVSVSSDAHEPLVTTEPLSVQTPDEDLFRACGGRTVHKAARHGLGLNGKLARVEAQERELLKRLRSEASGSPGDGPCEAPQGGALAHLDSQTKRKKRKKSAMLDTENAASAHVQVASEVVEMHADVPDDECGSKRKKHKKKSRKRDTEQEIVTVIKETCDEPEATDTPSRRKKKKISI